MIFQQSWTGRGELEEIYPGCFIKTNILLMRRISLKNCIEFTKFRTPLYSSVDLGGMSFHDKN